MAPPDPAPAPADDAVLAFAPGRLRTGLDLVRVADVAASLATQGERFVARLFTPAEAAHADAAPVHRAQRLAARFAAKEAVIKALGLSEVGVDWRDIEVVRAADGACSLALRGAAARRAHALQVREMALSLAHEDDYAVASVVVLTG